VLLKKKIILSVLIFCSLMTLCSIASAVDTNTYTVVKTSPTDPVKIGDIVLLTAQTSNGQVDQVVFQWYAPSYVSGPPTYTDTVTPASGSATSSYVVTEKNEWTVDVTFKRADGGKIYQDLDTKIKKVTIGVELDVFPLPEYPMLGTAGIAIAVFAALAVVKRKEVMAKFPF
jgi:hypothetical protein